MAYWFNHKDGDHVVKSDTENPAYVSIRENALDGKVLSLKHENYLEQQIWKFQLNWTNHFQNIFSKGKHEEEEKFLSACQHFHSALVLNRESTRFP